jgi:hypothetical protein
VPVIVDVLVVRERVTLGVLEVLCGDGDRVDVRLPVVVGRGDRLVLVGRKQRAKRGPLGLLVGLQGRLPAEGVVSWSSLTPSRTFVHSLLFPPPT